MLDAVRAVRTTVVYVASANAYLAVSESDRPLACTLDMCGRIAP